MNGILEDRHFLVTGGGRGIGRSIALELASLGACITLVSRSERDLLDTCEMITEAGGLCRFSVADVTIPGDVEKAVSDADSFSPLWGCVNSAGTNRTGPTVDYSFEDFVHVIATNLNSTFLVAQSVGRRLIRHGRGGRIINLSSQLGHVGFPGRAAYSASKHGVEGLTKSLAVEWASMGITVNSIGPTFIESALTRDALADPTFRAEVLSRIPTGQLGTFDQVAAAAAYLASPRASSTTGHALLVDAGWTAW